MRLLLGACVYIYMYGGVLLLRHVQVRPAEGLSAGGAVLPSGAAHPSLQRGGDSYTQGVPAGGQRTSDSVSFSVFFSVLASTCVQEIVVNVQATISLILYLLLPLLTLSPSPSVLPLSVLSSSLPSFWSLSSVPSLSSFPCSLTPTHKGQSN